jgi:hypothetical protein
MNVSSVDEASSEARSDRRLDFARHILRHILGPTLGGVEGDDAAGIAVLAGHQLGDDGFEVGSLGVGFPPDAALPANPQLDKHSDRPRSARSTASNWIYALLELHTIGRQIQDNASFWFPKLSKSGWTFSLVWCGCSRRLCRQIGTL